MSKNITVVIIDSGVNLQHPMLKNDNIKGYGIIYDSENNKLQITNDCMDLNGHGTAIYTIVKKNTKDVNIIPIRLFDKSLEVDEELLYLLLEYVYDNIQCHIINMSLGVSACKNINKMTEICNKLFSKGIIIISAFDNTGAISYPAALPNVIGVDSGDYCNLPEDFEYVKNSMVNVRAKGGNQRLAWLNPEYIIQKGSSFAAAYVTSYICNIMENGTKTHNDILNKIEAASNRIITLPIPLNNHVPFFVPKKALLFPLNKEVQNLVLYENQLILEIYKVCDVRLSGKVGSKLSHIMKFAKLYNDRVIENIDNINWNDDFDTLILGHVEQLSSIIGYDLNNLLLQKCLEYKKNVICFDNLSNKSEIVEDFKRNGLMLYYPIINETSIIQNKFGKLFSITAPVVGILGTSSSQGKFNLQMKLRMYFKKHEYNIGQLGSEPSSLLYGFDEVFHYGYNGTINFPSEKSISIVNSMMHNIDLKNPDIILVGAQSGTVPYCYNNIQNLPHRTMDFLLGTLPDIVILCVNYDDDFDYIKRSIQLIENLCESRVIALVMYPLKYINLWGQINSTKTIISKEDADIKKMELQNDIKLPVMALNDDKDIEKLGELIINYFQ